MISHIFQWLFMSRRCSADARESLQKGMSVMRIFSFNEHAGRLEFILLYLPSSVIVFAMMQLPRDFATASFPILVFFGSLLLFYSCLAVQMAVICRRFSDLGINDIFLILWIGSAIGYVLLANSTFLFLLYLCAAYNIAFTVALAALPGGRFNKT